MPFAGPAGWLDSQQGGEWRHAPLVAVEVPSSAGSVGVDRVVARTSGVCAEKPRCSSLRIAVRAILVELQSDMIRATTALMAISIAASLLASCSGCSDRASMRPDGWKGRCEARAASDDRAGVLTASFTAARSWCSFDGELDLPAGESTIRFELRFAQIESLRVIFVRADWGTEVRHFQHYPDPAAPAVLDARLELSSPARVKIRIELQPEASGAPASVGLASVAVRHGSREEPELVIPRLSRRPAIELRNERAVEYAEAFVTRRAIQVRSFAPVTLDAATFWASDPFRDVNWRTFFLALDPVAYLVEAHARTGETRFFEAARELIDDFIRRHPPGRMERDPAYVHQLWYDHGAAQRLENMLLFYEQHGETLEPPYRQRIYRAMREHAELLTSPTFYAHNQPTKWHNHGILQDRALLRFCASLSAEPSCAAWRRIAIDRLAAQLDHLITEEGVHVEHSPSYHETIIGLLSEVRPFAQGLESKLDERIEAMKPFLSWIRRPDGAFPLIGDSASNSELIDLDLTLAATSTVYERSGYFISRDGWPGSVHLTLIAAFNSITHKHHDELSITLFAGGREWLVDPGLYTYNRSDPLYEYARSARAHNTLVPIGFEDYPVDFSEIGRTRMVAGAIAEDYAYAVASHDLWPGVCAERTVLHVKPNLIYLVDRVRGAPGGYQQRFHLAHDLLARSEGNGVVVSSHSSRMFLELDAEPVLVRGALLPEPAGWFFPRYGEMLETVTVIVEPRADQAEVIIGVDDPEMPGWPRFRTAADVRARLAAFFDEHALDPASWRSPPINPCSR